MSAQRLFELPEDREPSHVLALPGDRMTLCGMKDAFPQVAAEHVQAHVDGHGMQVCPKCAEVMT